MPIAICVMKGTIENEKVEGNIFFYFNQNQTSIVMKVNLSGITENLYSDHGIHVHQYGLHLSFNFSAKKKIKIIKKINKNKR